MHRHGARPSHTAHASRGRDDLITRWLEGGARHRLAGTLVGLALVGILVPLLEYGGGADGPVGPSIPLFFLVPVLLSSAVGGRGAGVAVSCVAIVVWDWYFIHPFYQVTIASPRDVLALIVFLVVALLTGQLSTAVRDRADEALRRARSSEALYDLSTALITRADPGGVLPALTERLRSTFDLQACAVLLPTGAYTWHTAAMAGDLPPELRVEESRSVAAVATVASTEGRTMGLGRLDGGTATRRIFRVRAGEERAQFLPLRVGTHAVGILELVHQVGVTTDPERQRLLDTFANGAALALEQARLAQEEQAAAVAREADRLKSALLSSVSHDLRTPLAGIKAAASSLMQRDIQWSEDDREAFLRDINDEADRLTRLVSNLLDVSRIEAGAMRPSLDWVDVEELIGRVVRRLEPRLAGHPVRQEISAPLPAARLDAVQIEQVLTNLLENAAKYSPPGAPITVRAAAVTGPGVRPVLQIAVADQGMGIPAADQERIFDKFYRVAGSARSVSGTGMGLAIVKGLVEAPGGRVAVQSTPGQGSTFTITLPLEGENGLERRAPAAVAAGRGEEAVR